jgi:hypothetical protein
MKTYENWNGSLNEYLQIGDLVDEEMQNYFIDVLPPATMNGTCIQIGEPYSHVNGKATYPTLKSTGKGWAYAGHCHRGETEEPTESRTIIRFIKSTSCLVLEDPTESNDYIDCQFINKYEVENMSIQELEAEAMKLADRNYINKFRFNANEFFNM